jgi:hypothetical protein
MNKYNEFKEELSVYENKSKVRTRLAVLCNVLLRVFMTKSFDFIFTLSLTILPAILISGFSTGLAFICLILHFILWISIYKPITRYLGSDNDDMYNEFTLRIRILEDILSRK